MIKKTYLNTFEEINKQLSAGKKVYAYEPCYYLTKEHGIFVWNSEKGNKEYNAHIFIPAEKDSKRYWIEEEVKAPAVKPEVGFVFETNKGTQVYINLKKGNKFYGAELNGKQNSCKVFNEDGKVEMRNTYLVKKIK